MKVRISEHTSSPLVCYRLFVSNFILFLDCSVNIMFSEMSTECIIAPDVYRLFYVLH